MPTRLSRLQYASLLHVVSFASRAWNALGLAPQVLARFPRLGRELLIGQLPSIRPFTHAVADEPLRIAFFTMLGSHSYMTATDVSLARALRARGHHVSLVLCDQALPICENKPAADERSLGRALLPVFTFGTALFDASCHPVQTGRRRCGQALDRGGPRHLANTGFLFHRRLVAVQMLSNRPTERHARGDRFRRRIENPAV